MKVLNGYFTRWPAVTVAGVFLSVLAAQDGHAEPAAAPSKASAKANTQPNIPNTPSTLVVAGRIMAIAAPGSSGGPQVLPGQIVNAVHAKTGAVIGSGKVADPTGAYSITMNQPASFNGTEMGLQIVINGTSYPLFENGKPARLPYSARGSLFPTIIAKNLTVSTSDGAHDAKPTATKAPAPTAIAKPNSVCPAELPRCDVNGDGVFDERDIEFIKQALKQRPPDMRADVNGDGVVNTRDLIDAMRALTAWQRSHAGTK